MPPLHPAAFFEEIVICCRFQNRSLQPQAESGSCVVLSGHLAAMVGPPGRPSGVVVGYPPRTPAQARVCTAPGDVPAPCPRSPRGYRSMVRVAIGSAIHHLYVTARSIRRSSQLRFEAYSCKELDFRSDDRDRAERPTELFVLWA